MNSVDPFLDRVYVPGRYTCLDHAAEVWLSITGTPLHIDIQRFLKQHSISKEARGQYKRIQDPVSPCLVVFRSHTSSHIGVFIRGKVLHLTERDGVQYVPLHVVTTWFKVVRFYAQHT